MELTDELIPSLIDLTGGGSQALDSLRREFASGCRDPADTRVSVVDGRVAGALRLAPVGGGTWVLAGPTGDTTAIVDDALAHALESGARSVTCLVPSKREHQSLREALAAAGFVDRGLRLEFAASVDSLPTEEDSPLAWRAAGDFSPSDVENLLTRCAHGDPLGLDVVEAPNRNLEGWFEEPQLSSGMDCVQLGELEGETIAFCCVQVREGDGWSRISYLGIVPEWRRRGLGTWVHRHGFTMIRLQGGREYVGGTAACNLAMIALFRRHGCRERARHGEWTYRRE